MDARSSAHGRVVVVRGAGDLDRFEAGLAGTKEVGFDIEGVDLGRHGTISLVSVTFGGTCYLMDFYERADEALQERQLQVLRKVAESDEVCKVIHDARQDSDALHAIHGITLRHVFDTSVAHMHLTNGARRANLNAVLAHFGMQINSARISVDYRNYPRYWEQRPLSDTMIEHASGDTLQLLVLRERILFHVLGHRVTREPSATPDAVAKIELLLARMSLCDSSSAENLIVDEAASTPDQGTGSSSSQAASSDSASPSPSPSPSPPSDAADLSQSSNADVKVVRAILRQSNDAVEEYRRLRCARIVQVTPNRMGAVIGKQGCNVASIERIGCSISQRTGGFSVLADSEQAVKNAVAAIRSLERTGRLPMSMY